MGEGIDIIQIGFIAAMLFISFFQKSMLLNLAIFLACGAILLPNGSTMPDWWQACFVILMLWQGGEMLHKGGAF